MPVSGSVAKGRTVMAHSLVRRPGPARRAAAALLSVTVTLAPALAGRSVSHAAGERVAIWLTSTDDAAGRHVTRGLQPQAAIAFTAGTAGGGPTIFVDETTRFQQFTGAGASFTDTAAWLMNTSGALSSATRATV